MRCCCYLTAACDGGRHENLIAMKHWEIFKQLKSEVDERKLFEMSVVEQNLACREEHDMAKGEVRDALETMVRMRCEQDARRLVMLYNLRYERSKSCITQDLVSMLVSDMGMSSDDTAMVKKIVEYGGISARSGPGAKLLNNETTADRFKAMFSAKMAFIMEDANMNDLTQHTPLLDEILNDLVKGKMGTDEYPEINLPMDGAPQEIIVFIVGGATYEEAACVQAFNEKNEGCRVMLGGTYIHNSSSFIGEEVDSFMSGM